MAQQVATNATGCQEKVASRGNDLAQPPWQKLRMVRFHYIPEWAGDRQQSDLADATGANKSNVSRWFKGALPAKKHLAKLAPFLGADQPADLFMHPDEYRIIKGIRELNKKSQPAA